MITALTASTEYNESGTARILRVRGTMLSVSRWVVSCFTWIHFLRRLDTGLSGRGVWAIAESSPAQKNKQSIRIFPINRLVFHRFCVSLSFIGGFGNGYFMQVSQNQPRYLASSYHVKKLIRNIYRSFGLFGAIPGFGNISMRFNNPIDSHLFSSSFSRNNSV